VNAELSSEICRVDAHRGFHGKSFEEALPRVIRDQRKPANTGETANADPTRFRGFSPMFAVRQLTERRGQFCRFARVDALSRRTRGKTFLGLCRSRHAKHVHSR